MKDAYEEKPERTEGSTTFSDQDPEDYREVEEKYWKDKRLRLSLLLLVLLCVVLGALLWTVLSLMKSEPKRPQLVGERIRLPIKPIEKEEPTIPGGIGEKSMDGKPSEVGISEEQEPIASKSAELSMEIPEKGSDRAASVVSKGEPPGEEKEGIGAGIEDKAPAVQEEEKPQIAKVEEAEGRAKPEGKLSERRYTVHTASFRERARAERLTKELEEKGYEAFVEKADIPQKGIWYRVLVGRFSTREEAQTFARELRQSGSSYTSVREVEVIEAN